MNRAQIIARYALCEEEDDYDPKDLIMGEEFDLGKLIYDAGRIKVYEPYFHASLEKIVCDEATLIPRTSVLRVNCADHS